MYYINSHYGGPNEMVELTVLYVPLHAFETADAMKLTVKSGISHNWQLCDVKMNETTSFEIDLVLLVQIT